MKRMICLVIAAMLLLAAACCAETAEDGSGLARPSRTYQDTVKVSEITLPDGTALPPEVAGTLIVEIVVESEALTAATDLIRKTIGSSTAPEALYSPEVLESVKEHLPETADFNNYVASEETGLHVSGYDPAIGDLVVGVVTEVPYVEGEALIVMIGIPSIDAATGELVIVWYPQSAVFRDGEIKINMESAVLEAIQNDVGQTAVVLVYKDSTVA